MSKACKNLSRFILFVLLSLSPACEKAVELDNTDTMVGDAQIAVVRNALTASELVPVADTTIKALYPFKNSGTSTVLEVTAASIMALERTLVRFDQGTIAQQVNGQQLSSATLQVTISGVSQGWDGGGIAAHRMVMPWTENGATWACANDTWTGGLGDLYNNCSILNLWGMDWWSLLPQPYEETPSSTVPLHSWQTGAVSFDVTADVQSFLGGANNYGWMIAGTEDLFSGLWVDFYSRTTSKPPKLILEYGPALPKASVVVDVSSDTFVSELYPNRNREGETRLKANSDQAPLTKHALVQFSDSDISAAMTAQAVGSSYELKTAKLIMTVKDPWPFSLMNLGDTVNVHRMLQPWVVDRVTWECAEDSNPGNEFRDCSGLSAWDMGASDPADRPYEPIATDGQLAEITYGAEMVWDVTSDVAGFMEGDFQNFGWLFSKPDEPWLGFISFFSKEGGIPGRLELEFEYRDCTVNQPCGSGEGSCESDDECESGLVCEFGIEDRFEQPVGVGICWDPECRNDPFIVGCGSLNSVCGYCPCTQQCIDKSCGQDGCGGLCGGLCNTGDTCDSDSDCNGNLICGAFNGARYGHSASERACSPPSCTNHYKDPEETDIDCGGECGSCDQACMGLFCREGEQIPPVPLEVLSLLQGQFSRNSTAPYVTRFGIEWAEPDVLRYEERDDGYGRVALFEGEGIEEVSPDGNMTQQSGMVRAADIMVFTESTVPGWMKTGIWQFDVYPRYASSDLEGSAEEFVLFSFNSSANRIAFRAGPSSEGGGSLVIVSNNIIRHERALRWMKSQKLTITLDIPNSKVTVYGALNNNGEQAVQTSGSNPTTLRFENGPMRIGGLISGNSEANARISEPRRVSTASVSCVPDPSLCTAQCPCDDGEGGCTSDDQCLPHLECKLNIGERYGLPEDFGVCRLPLCDNADHPFFSCGSVESTCGLCPPCPAGTPNCTNKSCGSDGCFGSCGESCATGQAGCNSNADCNPGLVCGVDNGARFGFVEDVRVCWPPICEKLVENNIPCGSISDPCGLCPVCDSVGNCEGKQCGPDGCGGTCGAATDEEFCDQQTGQLVGRAATSRVNSQTLLSRNFKLPNEPPPDVDYNYQTPAVGTLPGDFNVTQNGDASYRIPLEVASGRAGVQPKLALVYNSETPNGYLGVGWRLDGLSAITRCGRSMTRDEETRGVKFDTSDFDRWCLDGKRLIRIGPAGNEYGDIDTAYHTEIDGFSRVIQKGGTNGNPNYFEVHAKNGLIFTYGGTDNSKIPVQYPRGEGRATLTWSLRRVRDRVGNSMDIRYKVFTKDVQGGMTREYYPESMSYTGFNGEPGHASVTFEYKDREFPILGYRYGSSIQQTQLLTSVTSSIEGRIIWQYRLEYLPETYHQKALLSEVSQCAQPYAQQDVTATPDRLVCKPSTVFGYDMVGDGLSDGSTLSEAYPGKSSFTRDSSPIVLDLDNNGIDDVMFRDLKDASNANPQWILLLNNTTWVETGVEYLESRDARLLYKDKWDNKYTSFLAINNAFVLDYDHDGRDDLLEYDVSKDYYKSNAVNFRVLSLETESGALPRLTKRDTEIAAPQHTNKNWTQWPETYVLDVDGDGLQDLLTCGIDLDRSSERLTVNKWSLYKGSQKGGFEQWHDDNWDARVTYQCGSAQVLDIEGDGDQDILLPSNVEGHSAIVDNGEVVWEGDNYFYDIIDFQYLSPGTILHKPDIFASKQYNYRIPYKKHEYRLPIPIDFNGDGLTDLIQIGPDNTFYYFINLGSEWNDQSLWNKAFRETGFKDSGEYYGKCLNELGGLIPDQIKVRTMDEDGDGRQDLLIQSQVSKSWYVVSSISSESAHCFEKLIFEYPATKPGEPQVVVYDANGDGIRDLGFLDPSTRKWRVWFREGFPKYLLNTISNGLKRRIEIEYSPLTNNEVYAHAHDSGDACKYPRNCKLPRRMVVSRHKEWNRFGDSDPTRSYRYGYSGAVSDSAGRGFIGFRSRVIEDETRTGSGIKTYTAYLYDNLTIDPVTRGYPLAGIPQSEVRVAPTNSGRVRQTQLRRTLSYEHLTKDNEARVTSFPHEEFRVQTISEWDLVDGKMVNENILSYSQTNNDYDRMGNRTRSQTDWLDTYEHLLETTIDTTDYTFEDDPSYEDSWLVSLPRRTTVTSGIDQEGNWREQTRTTQYDYFDSGQFYLTGLPYRMTREPDDDRYKLVTTFDYEANGNVGVYEVQGGGPGYEWRGDTRGGIISYNSTGTYPSAFMDIYGHIEGYDYDVGTGTLLGRRSQMDVTAMGEDNWIASFVLPDGFGRPIYTIDPDNTATRLQYNAEEDQGMDILTERRGSPNTHVWYDPLGRRVRTTVDGFDGELTQTFDYDELGRMWKTIRPSKHAESPQETNVEFDSLDRPIRVSLPDTNEIESCYLNNVSCTRDSRGYTECALSDYRGRTVKRIESDGSMPICINAATAAEQASQPGMQYVYGPFGALEKTRDRENNEVVQLTDRYGRVEMAADPNVGLSMYAYTPFGELWQSLDAKMNYSIMEYDRLGRLITRTDKDPTGDPDDDMITEWGYDNGLSDGIDCGRPYGTLCYSTNPSGDESCYTYDDLGRMQTATQEIDGEELMVGIGYTADSKPELVTYPVGPDVTALTVRYSYTDKGYLESVTKLLQNGEPDLNPYWKAVAANDFGQLTNERYGNGLSTTRRYSDTRAWLEGIETGNGLQKLSYWNDANGNLEFVNDESDDASFDGQWFTYDHLNRLNGALTIRAEHYDAEQYTLDEIGNIDQVHQWDDQGSYDRTLTYRYSSIGSSGQIRPHAVSDVTYEEGGEQSEQESFGYDEIGNLISRGGAPREPIQIDYTRFDKPSLITEDGGEKIRFSYDAEQQRTKRERLTAAGDIEESIAYFPGLYYRKTSGTDGEAIHNYLVGIGSRVVAQVVMRSGETQRVYYHHDDRMGSTVLVTDEEQQAVQSNEFGTYGVQKSGGETVTRLGYTGHEYESDLGLVNMGGRIYDPQIGRVLTPDPLVADIGMPQNFNAYSYALNNPYRYIDPSGFQSETETEGGGGACFGPFCITGEGISIGGDTGGGGSGDSGGGKTGYCTEEGCFSYNCTPTDPNCIGDCLSKDTRCLQKQAAEEQAKEDAEARRAEAAKEQERQSQLKRTHGGDDPLRGLNSVGGNAETPLGSSGTEGAMGDIGLHEMLNYRPGEVVDTSETYRNMLEVAISFTPLGPFESAGGWLGRLVYRVPGVGWILERFASRGVGALKLRPDIALKGGRSGQLVKDLMGPANSVVKGGPGRIFITNNKGQVIMDVTRDRIKPVVPGRGFGEKILEVGDEYLDLIRRMWGD